MTDAEKGLGIRWFEEVWNNGRREAAAELLADDAVIHDLGETIEQVRGFVRDGCVAARTGERIWLRADTLCLHGDRIDAARFARSIGDALTAEGVRILPVGAVE